MNKRGNSGCLIAVIVFLVLIVLAAAVVFFFLFRNRSGMPDIDEFISEVENSERTSGINGDIADKFQIEFNGGNTGFKFKLTNADLTFLANNMVKNNDDIPLEDVLLNCNEDETVDITAILTDFDMVTENPDVPRIAKSLLGSLENKRIYATVFIDYIGNNEFDIEIKDIKIGKLNIPFVKVIFTPLTDDISQMLTDQLEDIGTFELQEFSIEENYLEFSGILAD